MKFVCFIRGKSAPTTHFFMQRACVTTRYNMFCSKFCSSWLEVVACSQGKLRCKRLETVVRQEGSKWVEGSGNLQKNKNIVTNYACFCQTTVL